ncbi:N-acetylmuramoyl-L-alanine amidase family protein [Clostridium botulinum]|nr:N-acetylmuramoyl-L-alanine amidase family protein [Clostridium botulinum]NFN47107.1 N-acetylmuramoyl-L-alanine amidase family protein [Clostridium botulinum]
MNKFKQIIVSLFLTLGILIYCPSIQASASSADYLNRYENSPNNISISINDFNNEVKSFQMEFKIDGDVKLKNLKWDGILNSNSIEKSYSYDSSSNIVKIYVTSQKNLVDYGELSICTITVTGSKNTNYNISNNGEFKYIYSSQNKIDSLEILNINSPSEFTYIHDYNSEDTEKPDVPNIPDTPDTDKPEINKPNNGGSNGGGSSNNNSGGNGNNNNNNSNNAGNSNNDSSNNTWVKNPDGTWVYIENGSKSTGWKFINNKWYFMNNSGTMQTGWQHLNNIWYYLNPQGDMATGWLNNNGTWYYLNSNGAMASGWNYVDNKWYYLNSSGSMLTGWLNDKNTWYYLNPNGSMATNWLNDNGTWYYLYSNGAMACNTTIDNYKLNSNGAWIK